MPDVTRKTVTSNEVNGSLGNLCAHMAKLGEPPEDGEMVEMTLPSRHRRSSTLPLGHGGSHNSELLRVSGGDSFCSFKT